MLGWTKGFSKGIVIISSHVIVVVCHVATMVKVAGISERPVRFMGLTPSNYMFVPLNQTKVDYWSEMLLTRFFHTYMQQRDFMHLLDLTALSLPLSGALNDIGFNGLVEAVSAVFFTGDRLSSFRAQVRRFDRIMRQNLTRHCMFASVTVHELLVHQLGAWVMERVIFEPSDFAFPFEVLADYAKHLEFATTSTCPHWGYGVDSVLHGSIIRAMVYLWKDLKNLHPASMWREVFRRIPIWDICPLGSRVLNGSYNSCFHGLGHGIFFAVASDDEYGPLSPCVALKPLPLCHPLLSINMSTMRHIESICQFLSDPYKQPCTKGAFHSYYRHSRLRSVELTPTYNYEHTKSREHRNGDKCDAYKFMWD